MPNTITGLIQTLYTRLDVVSREIVGFIRVVRRDSTADRAAINQTVTFPSTDQPTVTDISPSMSLPDGADQTINPNTLTITNQKRVLIPWEGEETLSLENGGIYDQILSDQIEQAYRVIVNMVEQDILNAAYVAASRAVGTAGTAPFGTAGNMADMAGLEVILDDNGAPGGRGLVLTSRGYGSLRTNMSNLFQVNEAGTDDFLRRDVLGTIYNFGLLKTGAKASHNKGTGASYQTNGAVAEKDTTIGIDTGTGTVLAGDVVTFAGADDKYVVNTGLAAPGNLVINRPGAVAAIGDNVAMTVGDNYQVAGVGMSPDAFLLATRLPAGPRGGDAAVDEQVVTDPRSGLSFRVALYQGDHMNNIEISMAWGVKAVKSAHMALLLG